jgi:quinol monooxygenase YgiN
MYGLIGKLKTHPGQRDVLIDALLKAANFMRQLEGCYVYVVSKAADDPDTVWISEVWRSQADHQGSLAYDEVKAAIAVGRQLLAEAPTGFEVEPVGGVGIDESSG